MILHSECKRIIAQAHLLDDVVRSAPGFHLETVCRPIHCLMMRAVYSLKPMRGYGGVPERLNVVLFLLWQVMAWNIEPQRSAQSHVQHLDAAADG